MSATDLIEQLKTPPLQEREAFARLKRVYGNKVVANSEAVISNL